MASLGYARLLGLLPVAGFLFACQRTECQSGARVPKSVADLTDADPARVDPVHYKAELENEHVRIVRAHYGPHEQAAMHEHMCGRVIVNLNRQHELMQAADGKVTEVDHRAGEASWSDGRVRHNGKNLEDEGFDVIMIDIKSSCSGPR
jgi:hypothetical protein